MKLRKLAFSAIAIACLAALAACAGDGVAGERSDGVEDVRAIPRAGWIEVMWSHGGAEAYLVFREATERAGTAENGYALVGTVAGEFRVFHDVDVEAGATYRYAVAVEGGEVVAAKGEPVGPEPGRVLRVEFTDSVPAGATFSAVSEPAGIDCAAAGEAGCTAAFPSIIDATLSVRAEGTAWSWDGCDGVIEGDCTVGMSTDRTVTVSLAPANTLAVVVDPNGVGEVTNMNDLGANPAVECMTECTYPYPPRVEIGLSAVPIDADNFRFVGWGGACTGDGCTVTMDGDRRVEARFELIPPEIASFTASPDSVEPGERVTLAWNVSGGGDLASGELSIAIEPGVGELSARTGNVEVTPSSDTTYTLTVANASGTVRQSRAVSVDDHGPPPTIEYFMAAENEIDEGDWTWLHWSVAGPGNVTVSIAPDIGSVSARGKIKVEPDEDTTYRLTATNQHGEASETVEIEVEEDDDDDE